MAILYTHVAQFAASGSWHALRIPEYQQGKLPGISLNRDDSGWHGAWTLCSTVRTDAIAQHFHPRGTRTVNCGHCHTQIRKALSGFPEQQRILRTAGRWQVLGMNGPGPIATQFRELWAALDADNYAPDSALVLADFAEEHGLSQYAQNLRDAASHHGPRFTHLPAYWCAEPACRPWDCSGKNHGNPVQQTCSKTP